MKKKLFAALLMLLVFTALLPASIFRPKFALVLSGGGARGFAHVPVLMELDKRGIVPDIVIGTSMGAVIGSFYSAGYSGEELEELILNTDLMGYFLHLSAVREADTIPSPFTDYDTNLLTVEFGSSGFGASNGLIDDQYINGFLRRYLSKVLSIDDFDDLVVPFRAIGTDITNNRKVVFSSGSLFDAVRSSMAIPVVFSPVRLQDGSYIIDGGLEDNLPTDIARDLGADIVLAVDVNDARHLYGDHGNDMSTLSGSFSQFSDYLTEPNSAENYDEADWVIVPDTVGFSSMAFGSGAEILEAGRKAVEENIGVFDELEKRLERWLPMEKGSYSDLPAPSIEKVILDDVIPASYYGELAVFEEKPMDYETITEFEMVLDDIRRHEGLKSVTYDIKDGVIYVIGERFPSLSGSIFLGLSGGVGIRYDGSSNDNKPYFAYTPDFTISGRIALLERLDFTYGVVVNEGITVDAGLMYPFFSSAFLYGDIGLKYGQQAYFSIPGTEDYNFSSDVGLFLKMGIGYLPIRSLRLDAILGVDYTYINSPRVNQDNFFYPYIGIGLVYDAYDNTVAYDNGLEAELVFEFGGDFPDSAIAYSFNADIFGSFGPTDIFKFIFAAESATIRRDAELAKAYVSTKLGERAADYVYLMGGIRLPLPLSIFLDAGIFFEMFGGDFDLTVPDAERNPLPYSELAGNDNGMDIGGYVGVGIATSFGQISASLYISMTPRVSFMIGIE